MKEAKHVGMKQIKDSFYVLCKLKHNIFLIIEPACSCFYFRTHLCTLLERYFEIKSHIFCLQKSKRAMRIGHLCSRSGRDGEEGMGSTGVSLDKGHTF
jgi:hypothetical protein